MTTPSTSSEPSLTHPAIPPGPPSFAQLGLLAALERAVADDGYETPTPIQARAIPLVLEGRDVLGCAQTGTGKTAAFALPILDRLARHARAAGLRGPRVLVLTPTRELAAQIAKDFAGYGRYAPSRTAVVYGGVGQRGQVDAIRAGADIVVATPGRLLDLMGQGQAPLGGVTMLVLDEADRMLDMGFIDPIRRIVAALPARRQNLMFSATMPDEILKLARQILVDPVNVAVAPVATTADNVTQWVLFVDRANKRALLDEVLRDRKMTRVLVFTRTKRGADRVAQQLARSGTRASVIHGNKSQGARQAALEDFKRGRVRVLVATDIAARGIDVEAISHVINFEVPIEPESYIHRIGRTARAGAAGVALSFCDSEERTALRAIERLTRAPLRVVEEHPFAARPPSGRGSFRESTLRSGGGRVASKQAAVRGRV